MKLLELTSEDMVTINRWLDNPTIYYFMKPEVVNPNLKTISCGIHLEDGSLVGWATLFNIDMENEKAEFGIAVPGHQPRICYLATIETLRIGFSMGLNRIYIRPLKSNLRGNDQRERFGFVREGIERQSVKRGLVYEDVVVMSYLKSDFEGRWGHASNSNYTRSGASGRRDSTK